MRSLFVAAALVLVAAAATPADIKVKENPVPANSFARVSLDGVAAGADVVWDVYPDPVTIEEIPGGKVYFSGAPGTKYRVVATVTDWTAKKTSRFRSEVTMGGTPLPPVPPGPIPPGPVPPGPNPPAPDVLKSFRVILVHESGKPLVGNPFSIMYGKKMSDWLDANTTKDGWRRRDKDAATGLDVPAINAIWDVAKPKTAPKPDGVGVPCVIVERNGGIQVIPFEADQDAMIEKLKSIRGN